MARLLNRCCLVLLFLSTTLFAQVDDEVYNPKDYKSKEEFEKFYKRRQIVEQWHIQQLKKGALVVRLKTNKMAIEALVKNGNTALAEKKRLETAAVNLNTIRAYLTSYKFSKVYFIYSNSSDSLLNGIKENIFLDSSLQVNPSIKLTEDFYLIAERDHAYNSSIGFIPEDSAKFVKENGNPVKEMAIVVKNKFGHQLKRPFPYTTGDKLDLKKKSAYVTTMTLFGKDVPFNVGYGDYSKKEGKKYAYGSDLLFLNLPKQFTFVKLNLAVESFNETLEGFYRSSDPIDPSRLSEEVRSFLY